MRTSTEQVMLHLFMRWRQIWYHKEIIIKALNKYKAPAKTEEKQKPKVISFII
jgi:hypothetical protein